MRSILIIDSNPFLRRFVADLLTRGGFRVREASDTGEAAPFIRSDRPDIVVTDLVLPCRSHDRGCFVRLQDEFPGLSTIAISESPDSMGYLRLAATLGSSHSLANPFISRQLHRLIDEDVARGSELTPSHQRAHCDATVSRF